MKHDQAHTASNSGAVAKQEESQPYMLGPSIEQQQLNQQALKDAGENATTGTAASQSQIDSSLFQPQLSNGIIQRQGQVSGDRNQQCEKHTLRLYIL